MGILHFLSTLPEVERLVRVHSAQSLSTMTVTVFVLSVSQRKLNTHLGLLLTCCVTRATYVADFPPFCLRRLASLLSLRT